ncbi:MAG: hypothetical protein AB7O21_19805 [Gammaproteobacteria bacterium]
MLSEQWNFRIGAAVTALLLGMALPLSALAVEVIFSNFDPAAPLPENANHFLPLKPNSADGSGFVTTAIGFKPTLGPVSLSTLSTLVWRFAEIATDVRVEFSFHRDGGEQPGEVLEMWTFDILAADTSPWAPYLLTLTSSAALVLQPGALYWLNFASDQEDIYYLGGSDSIAPGVYRSIYAGPPTYVEEGWFTSAPAAFEWIASGDAQILSGGGSFAHLHVTGNPVPVPSALALLLPMIMGWGTALAGLDLRVRRS